jgi:hypothetical protein
MAKLKIDSSLQNRLEELGNVVELLTPHGTTFGYFISPEVYRRVLYAWANSLVSDEELETAKNEVGGKTLAEILPFV